jgi:hypothetical protein
MKITVGQKTSEFLVQASDRGFKEVRACTDPWVVRKG